MTLSVRTWKSWVKHYAKWATHMKGRGAGQSSEEEKKTFKKNNLKEERIRGKIARLEWVRERKDLPSERNEKGAGWKGGEGERLRREGTTAEMENFLFCRALTRRKQAETVLRIPITEKDQF